MRCGAAMSVELERQGIPTALVATLTSTAITVGANRIVVGAGIQHPVGNPKLAPEEELKQRCSVVELALTTLTTELSEQRVFEAAGAL